MYYYSNILVPFDGSEAAKRALESAVSIAAENAVITILEAADDPVIADPTVAVAERMAGVVRSEEESEKEIAAYWSNVESSLAEVAKSALDSTGKKLDIRAKVVQGAPVPVIVDFAQKNDVDIIVMGRRGLGSVRAMLGSVSQRVARETDLPLLLVK